MSDANFEVSNAALKAVVEQAVKPEVKEIEAIKAFCAIEIQRRAAASVIAEDLKLLRAKSKALKESLVKDLQALQVNGGPAKCCALSKEDAKRLETAAHAMGFPSVPPYLRLISSNKDASITPEIIQEALESISEEDMREAKPDEKSTVVSVIRTVVLQHVRRAIRSFSESLKLVPSIQRGLSTYDVPEASSAVADKMFLLWDADQNIKKLLSSKDTSTNSELEGLKTSIESFFIRTGITAQRIVIENKPYKLVRRVSVRKPKIGIGRLEKLLDEVLEDLNTAEFRPVDLIRALQIQVTSVAPETKSTVSLCSVKESKD